jgi:poly(U)-specific endoribonuclease
MIRFLSLTTLFLCVGVFAQKNPIYQELWSIDQSENGLKPVLPAQAAHGEVVVDEQNAYSPGAGDAAPTPLFPQPIQSKKIASPTYRTFEALLDNYEFSQSEPEDAVGANPTEDKEREDFLTAALSTKVLKRTLEFINANGLAGRTLAEKEFANELRAIWFEPYTNYFGGKASPDCVGFEHVFVGEQGSGSGIGGYHFWYTFYLQEKRNEVNFLGHNYVDPSGAANPTISTLAMSWDTPNGPATKEISGFLIGPSPEMLLAWGTLAYYQNAYSNPNDDFPIATEVEGSQLDLILYREVEKSAKANTIRGRHIRTFYPKYQGSGTGTPVSPAPHTTPSTKKPNPSQPTLKISQALINPSGAIETGREWVEITNFGNAEMDLSGWTLRDRQGRAQALSGTIAAGATLKVEIVETNGEFPLLANRHAWITLNDASGKEVLRQSYEFTKDGEVTVF